MNMQDGIPAVVDKFQRYTELKKEFDEVQKREKLEGKKALLQCALKIQHFCGLPGEILLSQLYIMWAREHKENQKIGRGFAVQATQALGLVRWHGYENSSYAKWVETDPSLTIDINTVLNDLLDEKLLLPEDLEQQACATTFQRRFI